MFRNRSGDSSGSEAEDFDRSAAFFTQVVSKKKKGGNVTAAVSGVDVTSHGGLKARTAGSGPTTAADSRLNGTHEEKVALHLSYLFVYLS